MQTNAFRQRIFDDTQEDIDGDPWFTTHKVTGFVLLLLVQLCIQYAINAQDEKSF